MNDVIDFFGAGWIFELLCVDRIALPVLHCQCDSNFEQPQTKPAGRPIQADIVKATLARLR